MINTSGLLLFPWLFLWVGGCGEPDRPGAIPSCTGPTCNPNGSSGEGDSSVDGALDDADAEEEGPEGAVGTVSIAGQVVQFVDDAFDGTVPFAGIATVRVPTLTGDEPVAFDGSSGTGFEASGIPVGDRWFYAALENTPSILSTYSYLTIPAGGSTELDVPILDRSILEATYLSLPEPLILEEDASQVVVVFEKGGNRVSGVSLTDWPTSEAVAYDAGVGYATDLGATGALGVAILINATGAGKLTWKASDGQVGSLSTITHVAGRGTFLRILL